MIPNALDTAKVSSNIDGEVGQFSVDENSLSKIMSVLTNLYSDPEGAVVREYLTNALDAQIEAQENDPTYVWRPIEVTTPSHFSKTYKVRDFGTGMNADDLRDIYSKYGKSTKENTNSQTGMLGLGSKCALTYTGQFTITGYKNGVRTTAIVSKDEQDIPSFMIVDTSATDEPNGVEISVPVRDRSSFADKTAKFLRWWKPGQVLVDGREPETHDYKEVKPGIFISKTDGNYRYSYNTPDSVVIMGNVPYTVDAEYVPSELRDAGIAFAAYVPMGSVDFPPSRERLYYNALTKKTLASLTHDLFDFVLTEALNEIKQAASYREAWTLYHNLPYYFSNHRKAQDLKYKGQSFADAQRIQHDFQILDWDWQQRGQVSDRKYMGIGEAIRTVDLFVTGVDITKKQTAYWKKKVVQYIQEKNLAPNKGMGSYVVYLMEKDVDSVWIADIPRIDFDTIKALKLPRNPSQGPRVEAPYDFYTFDASKNVVTHDALVKIPVAAGKTLVHVSPADLRESHRKHGISERGLSTFLGEDVVLVVLAKNRFEKYKRDYANSIELKDWAVKELKKIADSVTDAEASASRLSYHERAFLEAVEPDRLLDPELKALAETVRGIGDNKMEKMGKFINTMRAAGINLAMPDIATPLSSAADKYPLIDEAGRRHMKHLVFYVNAIYKSENP